MPNYRRVYRRGTYGTRRYQRAVVYRPRATGSGAYGSRRMTYGRTGAYTRRRTIRGRGGFFEDAGTKGGAWLGRKVGRWVGRITGVGSYNEVANGNLAPLPPQFNTQGKNDYVEICHREYITDIYSSATAGAIAVNSYYVNPSDTITFPWLSQIAATSFQQYMLHGCIFEFKSYSSDALNSTNTALGSVVCAVNYDSTDAVPTTRAQLENTDWSQSYKPSQSFAIPVECAKKETFGGGLLYTRQSQTIPSGEDRKTYDLARVDIATLGVQGASVNLGSLYVTYKCRLYKTLMCAPGILNGCAHFSNTTGVANSTPLGTAGSAVTIRNNMGVTLTATVIDIPLAYVIPNAVYQVSFYWVGGSASNQVPSFTYAGCGTVKGYTGSSNTLTSTNISNTNSTCTNLLYIVYIQMPSAPTADATITLGTGGTITNTVTIFDLQINQVSGIWSQNI